MKHHLCIHGHFYQPPREDPWLDRIMPEGSAAPMFHWNQRIVRESYAPLAWARRLDGKGRITSLVNCYEWISFNFGPTLLRWLERADPTTYGRVLQGDKASAARLGKGNAMAQIYHHVIMPLAGRLDKEVETAWAMEDFRARFGRDPEGLWLSESAADLETLEVLAEAGIAFTVLAPRQCRSVADLDAKEWTDVAEHELDVSQPYLVELPSGRSISVFFYDGPVSQAIAFERLLEDGEGFWQRIVSALPKKGLLSLATDGETYGHHFTFGEMALAFVLSQTFFNRDEVELTNYAAYLKAHPPVRKARIHEPSSWSCIHGVERWKSDCGCTTGGGPGWNQKWRMPLRQGLDRVKAGLDKHFFTTGKDLFQDPAKALRDYGRILAESADQQEYAAAHFKPGLTDKEKRKAWKLLSMEQWGLASFASCAWFFEELARIEPLNNMTFALRAMDLCAETGGPDLEERFKQDLAQAWSNMKGKGTGRDLFENEVLPRRESLQSLGAQALLTLMVQERLPGPGEEPQSVDWPGVSVELSSAEEAEPDGSGEGRQAFTGQGAVSWRLEAGQEPFAWRWQGEATDLFGSHFEAEWKNGRAEKKGFSPLGLPWNKRQAVAVEMVRRLEEEDWQWGVAAAEQAAPLFQTWQEAQNTQTCEPEWRRLWPMLAFTYARGMRFSDDQDGAERKKCLELFLQQGAAHCRNPEPLERRIQELGLELLRHDPPLWTTLDAVARRVRRLGLEMDWWPVQNRVWELISNMVRVPDSARKTAALLNLEL